MFSSGCYLSIGIQTEVGSYSEDSDLNDKWFQAISDEKGLKALGVA